MYGEAKAMLLAWLVLPQFKGATWVYETIIGPGTARLRTELQKVPALERVWNKEDAASVKVTCNVIVLLCLLSCATEQIQSCLSRLPLDCSFILTPADSVYADITQYSAMLMMLPGDLERYQCLPVFRLVEDLGQRLKGLRLQALSPEEETRSVSERKTRVTLTTQEARDALISKIHDIEGAFPFHAHSILPCSAMSILLLSATCD